MLYLCKPLCNPPPLQLLLFMCGLTWVVVKLLWLLDFFVLRWALAVSFLPCLQFSLYAHENTTRWAYAFQAVQMKIVFCFVFCSKGDDLSEVYFARFHIWESVTFFFFFFCNILPFSSVFFFFLLGIYLFSLNNIVRRHTTLTSLHREKIMWKAERQRKFKNISLLSQIQYVLYIQRRAKSVWW